MTQPSKESSKLADSSDNPQIGERGAAVTAVAAATVAAVSYTATNPTAPTDFVAADISASYVEAEVQAVADGVDTLEDEVTAIEVIVSQIVVDDLAQDVAIDALAVDVALIRTAVNALIERIEAQGLIADN